MNPLVLVLAGCTGSPADGVASSDEHSSNSAPTDPVVEVRPAVPVAGMDGLVCAVTAGGIDSDDDELSWTTTWTVDGAPADIVGDTVEAAGVAVGQAWACTVMVSDGVATASATSETVTAIDWAELDQWAEPEVSILPDPLVPGETAHIRYTGSLAQADGLKLVYGINGWSSLQAGSEALDFQTDMVTYYGYELEMTAVQGGFEGELKLPGDAEALHGWFEVSTGDEEGSRDDNDGREFHASVHFPYIGPFLTWSDDVGPQDGVVVSWETRTPSLGAVAWGVDELDHVAIGTEVDTVHHVTLSGLEPGTTVSYRVLDSTGLASDEAAFTTAEADATAFRFVVVADMQDANDGSGRWSVVSGTILEEHDPDFLFMPGDLAADDRPGFWWTFFRSGHDLFAAVPSLPMPGNHDTPGIRSDPDTTSYRRYFVLPEGSGTEDFYSIEYGNSLLLALSTEDSDSLMEGASQWTWLEQTLASTWDGPDRVYDHVFAGYHHPSYDVGKRFGFEAENWRGFTELFDFNVDWVFMGHEHIYQRFSPLNFDALVADEYGVGSQQGVGYLVVPSAGSYLYAALALPGSALGYQRDLLEWPELEEADRSVEVRHGYVVVDVDGPAMTLSSIAMEGDGEDQFPSVIDQVSTSGR